MMRQKEEVRLQDLNQVSFFDGRKRSCQLGLERLNYECRPVVNLHNNNTGVKPHDFAWDGQYLYSVEPTSPGVVRRIDPITLAVVATLTLPADGDHNGSYGVVYAFGSLWVANAIANFSVTRVDPVTMTEIINILIPEGSCHYGCTDGANVYFVTFTNPSELIIIDPTTNAYTTLTLAGFQDCRSVRYECGYLFTAEGTNGNRDIIRITPGTWAIASVPLGLNPMGFNCTGAMYDIGSDGNNIFVSNQAWGGNNPLSVHKIDPSGPTVIAETWIPRNIIDHPTLSYTVHYWAYDGKYIYGALYLTDHPAGLLKVNPDDLSWQILWFPENHPHVILWNGLRLYIGFDLTPGEIRAIAFGPMATTFACGITGTFPIDALGTQTIAVNYYQPFSIIPCVIVSLIDVTDNTAVITTVEAENVTTTTFDARALVHVAGAGDSTAKFQWLAITKDLGNIL